MRTTVARTARLPRVVSYESLSSIAAVSDQCFVFFFFQAEDGIRDVAVTGVQTCALPILENPKYPSAIHSNAPHLEEASAKILAISVTSPTRSGGGVHAMALSWP